MSNEEFTELVTAAQNAEYVYLLKAFISGARSIRSLYENKKAREAGFRAGINSIKARLDPQPALK